MKNIKDINTLEDAILMLKELYIANMTQLAILEGKVDRRNKEQIASLERKLEKGINIIVFSKEIQPAQKIKYIKAAIESTFHLDDKDIDELEDLYVTTMVQKAITTGSLNRSESEGNPEIKEKIENAEIEDINPEEEEKTEVDINKVLTFQTQVEKNIEKLLGKADIGNEDKKKNCLKIAIENIYNIGNTGKDDRNPRTKIEEFSKQYLQKLSEKINSIKGITEDERSILKLIKEAQVKIHDDKDISETEKCDYGDLVKDKRIKSKVIFQNSKMIFKRLSSYSVGKSIKNEQRNDSFARIETEKISKYEFITLTKTGEMVSLNFFGNENLENNLHDKSQYIPAVLAAIAKAKEANREHIGEISIIDEDLGTAVVKYDDKLEQKVKELKQREENKTDKEEPPVEPRQ